MFRKGRNRAPEVRLPDERKALAERYTIDAEEAQLRARRAAEEQAADPGEQVAALRAAEIEARREAETRAAAERAAEEQAAAQRAAEEQAAAQRAAAEQARREAEEQAAAQRAAAEQARREAEEQAAARRAAEEEAERVAVVVPIHAEPDEDARAALAHLQQTPESEGAATTELPPPSAAISAEHDDDSAADLPLYGWLRQVSPATPDAADWTRELVRAKEARSEETRKA